jgi:hypothetical protein
VAPSRAHDARVHGHDGKVVKDLFNDFLS